MVNLSFFFFSFNTISTKLSFKMSFTMAMQNSVRTRLILVIISQCIHTSNHCVAHQKLINHRSIMPQFLKKIYHRAVLLIRNSPTNFTFRCFPTLDLKHAKFKTIITLWLYVYKILFKFPATFYGQTPKQGIKGSKILWFLLHIVQVLSRKTNQFSQSLLSICCSLRGIFLM